MRVTLRDTRDETGRRFLEATWEPGGPLVISGQDLGRGVSDAFGEGLTEYEWTWTIAPPDVQRLATALGRDEAVLLPALALRFSGEGAGDLARFLDEAGITRVTWSRIGD
jgi:hypothetical protein